MNVVSFYRFVEVLDAATLQRELQRLCDASSLLGTILVADEGINGTLAGSREGVLGIFDFLASRLGLDGDIDARWTEATEAPFRRMRVRLKKEIVTMGRVDVEPQRSTGVYVSPEQWNALLEDDETIVIDTRNRYEVEVGTFPGAISPETDSFREFPEFAEAFAKANDGKKIAMFCTGGIRCEKASALMQQLGFEEVYQLQGGILNYLESTDDEDNRWAGECFVFDSRVAVDRDRAEGGYVQCHACRRPLSSEDLQSPDYRKGVSCPRCISTLQPERRERLEERRKQVCIADERGTQHIGQQLKEG